MSQKLGWVALIAGFIIGVLPSMIYQVWNGASLLGLTIAGIGGYFVMKGQFNDV